MAFPLFSLAGLIHWRKKILTTNIFHCITLNNPWDKRNYENLPPIGPTRGITKRRSIASIFITILIVYLLGFPCFFWQRCLASLLWTPENFSFHSIAINFKWSLCWLSLFMPRNNNFPFDIIDILFFMGWSFDSAEICRSKRDFSSSVS